METLYRQKCLLVLQNSCIEVLSSHDWFLAILPSVLVLRSVSSLGLMGVGCQKGVTWDLTYWNIVSEITDLDGFESHIIAVNRVVFGLFLQLISHVQIS